MSDFIKSPEMLKFLEDASEKYKPLKIKFLFICESPPLNCSNYFYFEENRGKQVLFATIMKAIFDIDYTNKSSNKKDLLEKFKK